MSSALTEVMRNCWKISDPALPRLLRWKEAGGMGGQFDEIIKEM